MDTGLIARWRLVLCDAISYMLACFALYIVYPNPINRTNPQPLIISVVVGFVCIMVSRTIFGIYRRVWRYATARDYLMLVFADIVSGIVIILLRNLGPKTLTFARVIAVILLTLLGALCARLGYQYVYLNRNSGSKLEAGLIKVVNGLTGAHIQRDTGLPEERKIKVAIVGAGSVGAMLAEDLLANPKSMYVPVCFVDVNRSKVGGLVSGIPVISNDPGTAPEALNRFAVQEVVLALPNADQEKRKEIYNFYSGLGYKIKSYDYPSVGFVEDGGAKRAVRDFAIEDLLYRREIRAIDDTTKYWYRGKTILITGGGGSIGSELARQIAKTGPKKLILLDIYENSVYDVQQELKMKYGDGLNLRVEIASITDREHIMKLFLHHIPDIVLHAAAHKHVPLMERNVIEAVKNNVFGTLNVVEACEKCGVKRFIMISTDKAVNPTNVMGATKRMCEMIVLSRKQISASQLPNLPDKPKNVGGEAYTEGVAAMTLTGNGLVPYGDGKALESAALGSDKTGPATGEGQTTSFSATRFGNVLGSNGSVIPLFKRQIASGGPITLTDKRITRYFMTIPEACQLVMISGAMASNGELYVLDMGKPIKIVELAEDMIRLSGMEPYKDIDIVEVGLRPGEKLYEELLVKTEELDKTKNDLIFIERDKALSETEIKRKLNILKEAVGTGSNKKAKAALMEAVPTYRPTAG